MDASQPSGDMMMWVPVFLTDFLLLDVIVFGL